MKTKIILAIIVLVVLVGAFFLFFYDTAPKDLSGISEAEIAGLLATNDDVKNYMQKYPDFVISKKEILTPESIEIGKDGPNFKEVYYDLELEDNRYMRVDLMNQAGKDGLIIVLDFRKEEVIKAYGVLLIQTQ